MKQCFQWHSACRSARVRSTRTCVIREEALTGCYLMVHLRREEEEEEEREREEEEGEEEGSGRRRRGRRMGRGLARVLLNGHKARSERRRSGTLGRRHDHR